MLYHFDAFLWHFLCFLTIDLCLEGGHLFGDVSRLDHLGIQEETTSRVSRQMIRPTYPLFDV